MRVKPGPDELLLAGAIPPDATQEQAAMSVGVPALVRGVEGTRALAGVNWAGCADLAVQLWLGKFGYRASV